MYYRQRYRWAILYIRIINFQDWDGVLDLSTRDKLYEGGLVILGSDGEPVVVVGKMEDSSVMMRCVVSYLKYSRTRC